MAKGRTDTATRRVDAPPAAVRAALTDPDALPCWLPPEGASMTVEAYDPRPGGDIRLTLTFHTAPGGKTTATTDHVTGKVVALEPDRMIWAIAFDSPDPAFAGAMRMTWQSLPAGTGTAVTIIAENVPPGISAADHAAGLSSTLDNLARHLARS